MSMVTQFSPSDLKALFTKFHAVYGYYGAGALKGDTEEAKLLRDEWWKRLKGNTTAEVMAAADSWISSSHDKWPNPGQFLGVLIEQRPERKVIPAESREMDECPCGCRWDWYRVVRKDGTTLPRWIQGCRARRDGLALASEAE